MFSEIVKLTPTIDRAALGQMFRTLNQRFAEVSKKFGQGVKNAFKFGGGLTGVAALAGVLVTKLLNPLERAESAIDRILNKGDDAATNAEDLGTTPGKMLRLEALAAAKGLDADQLRTLLTKFQTDLAAEQEIVAAPGRIQKRIDRSSDPKERRALEIELKQAQAKEREGGLLREFVNEKDTADAFFKFVQSVNALEDPSQRTAIRTQVFGEKVRGKASEFLNATDFAGLLKDLPSAATLDAAVERIGKLADEKDRLAAIRALTDLVTKAKLINQGQINAIAASEQKDLNKENDALANFTNLKVADDAIDSLMKKLEKTLTDLTVNVIPPLVKGLEALTKVLPSASQIKEVVGPVVTGAVDTAEQAALDFVAWLDRVKKGEAPGPDAKLTDEQLKTTSGPSDMAIIQGLTNALNTIWAEFKSSRFYRWGGGGD